MDDLSHKHNVNVHSLTHVLSTWTVFFVTLVDQSGVMCLYISRGLQKLWLLIGFGFELCEWLMSECRRAVVCERIQLRTVTLFRQISQCGTWDADVKVPSAENSSLSNVLFLA